MRFSKITYTEKYYLAIRDFLVDTYRTRVDFHNWQIDCWNFSLLGSQVIIETVEFRPVS